MALTFSIAGRGATAFLAIGTGVALAVAYAMSAAGRVAEAEYRRIREEQIRQTYPDPRIQDRVIESIDVSVQISGPSIVVTEEVEFTNAVLEAAIESAQLQLGAFLTGLVLAKLSTFLLRRRIRPRPRMPPPNELFSIQSTGTST